MSGKITLDQGVVGKVVVGLPYTSVMAPLPVDFEGDGTSTVGLYRSVKSLDLQLYRSVGGSYSSTNTENWEANRDHWKNETFSDIPFVPEVYNDPVEPFSGVIRVTMAGGLAEKQGVVLKQDKPLPFNVQSIVMDIDFAEHS